MPNCPAGGSSQVIENGVTQETLTFEGHHSDRLMVEVNLSRPVCIDEISISSIHNQWCTLKSP